MIGYFNCIAKGDSKMNQKSSWKKTEEVEINLVDLLQKLFGQWKPILVCAVAFAFLLGGYKYMKDRSAVQTVSSSDTIEEIELTDLEEKNVNAAIELTEEIEGIQEYLDESILMNIDPNHKNRVILLYSIDDATKQTKQKIIESYLTYIGSGGALDAIKELDSKKWDVDKGYLAELISAYQDRKSTRLNSSHE